MTNGSIRRSSMTMALCGLMAALALVLPLLGSVFPLAAFACPLLLPLDRKRRLWYILY